MKRSTWISLAFLSCIIIISIYSTQATISKQKRPKYKAKQVPPGVARNNKKMPTPCHACRLFVDKLEELLQKPAAEEQAEETKEERRRKRREKKNSTNVDEILEERIRFEEIMDKLCLEMKQFLPQADKKYFRYVDKTTLKDTTSLKSSASDPDVDHIINMQYNTYVHDEIERVKEMCESYMDSYRRDLIEWFKNTEEDKPDLRTYLCNDRILSDGQSQSCMEEINAKSDLWSKTFETILDARPELRHQEF